jgi:hypothetical protein
MTTQEAYESIRAYFTRPGAQLAKKENGFCSYRLDTSSGVAKCAVGCLIPDDLYNYKMEDVRVGVLIRQFPELNPIFEGVSIAFLENAQWAHDATETEDVEEFIEELDRVALYKHQLKVVKTS